MTDNDERICGTNYTYDWVVERLAEHRDLLYEMAETWSRRRSGGEAEWPIAFSQAMMLARA